MDLKTVLHSGIPIIGVTSRDPVHVREVLEAWAGVPVKPFIGKNTPAKISFSTHKVDLTDNLYQTLSREQKTLVLVNQPKHLLVFHAGELTVPRALAMKYLSLAGAEQFYDCVAGLTLKEIAEIILLTRAHYGQINRPGLLKIKAQITHSSGSLQYIEPVIEPFYTPDPQIKKFAEVNKPYFITKKHPMLTPRGLLLNGPPGCGKTSSAKYLSAEWGVPLYRLDITSALGMYVGQSESSFAAMLQQADREEPCVMLIDEVEKLFTNAVNDQGVTSRLLSQLLWWLQEHTSRVFTVMTTNNQADLPPELYRGRRVDKTLTIPPLEPKDALVLATKVGESLNVDTSILRTLLSPVFQKEDTFSHASVIQSTLEVIKEKGLA